MNKFGIQIERINKIQSPLHISIDKTLLWIYSIIIPQFTGKYFSNFSNLQRNITSRERLFILDAVLKPCWGVQHAFQRRSARLVLARLKMVLYVDLSRAIWKSSGTSQHSTASKIGLSSMYLGKEHYVPLSVLKSFKKVERLVLLWCS